MDKVKPSPLVDKTASAIFESDSKVTTKSLTFEKLSDSTKDRYREMAVAALVVALSEPVEVGIDPVSS